MEMPEVLSKYIQDFIRPKQPKLFESLDDFTEMYDYFLDLKSKLRPKPRYKYKIGMEFTFKEKSYIIEDISRSFIYSNNKKYKKTSKMFNIINLEHKTAKLKMYFKADRMLKIMDKYIYLFLNIRGEMRLFYKNKINKSYLNFWMT